MKIGLNEKNTGKNWIAINVVSLLLLSMLSPYLLFNGIANQINGITSVTEVVYQAFELIPIKVENMIEIKRRRKETLL